MARKLDIYRTLSAADQRQFGFYNRLTEEERKEFVLKIVLQFANSIAASPDFAEDHLIKVNERVNQYGDLMWKHPDLCYAMLASCGGGRVRKHEYTKTPSRATLDTTLIDFLALHWPGLNQDEANIILGQMDKAAFTELLRGSGLTNDQEKKIAAAYAKQETKTSRKG